MVWETMEANTLFSKWEHWLKSVKQFAYNYFAIKHGKLSFT